MRILLIEDDVILSDVLLKSLSSKNYVVDLAEDGKSGWEFAQGTSYDLILMDILLPKLDGITLCQRLRSQGCTAPILLLTAKNANSDRIRGLDAGADDYLSKPFDLGELHARVRALLRRADSTLPPILQVGELQLDPSSCKVTYANKLLGLTPKEYSLLELFLRNPTRVFSRGDIIEHLWTFDDPPQEETVKAHIKGLRQKLKTLGAVDWIENVYGLGYRLNPKTNQEHHAVASSAKSFTKAEKSSHTVPSINSTSESLPGVEQQFNQAISNLWSQYQGLMTERLAVLQQATEAIQNGELSQELHQSAQQAAHKLAGVLGMFERETGTQIAREIEQILQENGTLEFEHKSQLRSLVQELDKIINLPSQPSQVVEIQPTQTIAAQNDTCFESPNLASLKQQVVQLLVVDDDPSFLAALRLILEPWGVCMIGLEYPRQFWEVLPKVTPDLLILDVEMPQCSGIELCKEIRDRPQWQALPILFLTAHRESEMIQQIFAAGADDYITKPIVGPELLTRIINRLERIRLLQSFSNKDPLTGLFNQPYSYRSLETLLGKARENQYPFCLALFSMPSLRKINLRYGHAIGNQVLQRWGQIFQSAFRDDEVLGYWGNGEFVIAFPQATQTDAQERLATILTTLRQQIFTAPNGKRFQVSCNLALAAYPTDELTIHSLYQVAFSRLKQGLGDEQ